MKKALLILGLCLFLLPAKSEALITYSYDNSNFSNTRLSVGFSDAIIDNSYVAWTSDECDGDCQDQVSYFDGQNIFKLTNYADPDISAGESGMDIEDFNFSSGKISWKINDVLSTYNIPGYAPVPVPQSDFRSYWENGKLYIDDGAKIINLTDPEGKVRIGEGAEEYPQTFFGNHQSGNQLLFSYYQKEPYSSQGPVRGELAWFDYDLQHIYFFEPDYENVYGAPSFIRVSNNHAIYQRNGGHLLHYISYDKPATSTIPEPATIMLLGTGLLGGAFLRKKSKA